MTAVAFDTLKFAMNLRDKARPPPEQAEGFAVAIAEALQDGTASRGDLQSLRQAIKQVGTELKADIQELRSALKGEIPQVRSDILRMDAKIEAAKVETIKGVFELLQH